MRSTRVVPVGPTDDGTSRSVAAIISDRNSIDSALGDEEGLPHPCAPSSTAGDSHCGDVTVTTSKLFDFFDGDGDQKVRGNQGDMTREMIGRTHCKGLMRGEAGITIIITEILGEIPEEILTSSKCF